MENNMELENVNDMDKSKYITFHKQLDIEGIVLRMDNAFTAEALNRVINVAEATIIAFKKYPFEDDVTQRNSLIDLDEITDEAKNTYITARKNELRAAAAALDDTIPHHSPRRSIPAQRSPQPSTSSAGNRPRKSDVPPITINKIQSPATLLKKLQEITKIKLVAKLTGTSLRIFPQTPYAYHTIRRYVDEKKLQGHTYMLPEQRKLKAVIRSMPVDMPTQDVAEELLCKGFKTYQIYIMTNKKTGTPMPLFLVILEKNEENQKIFNLKELACMQVTIEALRKKYGLPQCFRCQGFFHSSNYCTRTPRCVKCAGEHLTRECTKPVTTPPTCCLCEGPHPANYLQCPRNPANHPPMPKVPQPKPENSWRKRLANSTPLQQPPQPATLTITEDNFPQLPAPPQQPKQNNKQYQTIKNPLEVLKDPDVQDLYNTLEKFVNIAKNVHTPAKWLQALFKLLN
ncbi:nucleic-acid-binding protein from transposon X-element [Nephila pilipes]|uniref:Nucleic-acid-binding protein from transposon X-element n=1 Tax=Nephila pilipes TaxID=299642 RepID=A0A8X6UUX3_NEPPI|nr:nucleic-acid-binding protein from transposon X-element [Nephila pilipes]